MRNGKRTSRERINEYALESENVQHADAPLPELPPMPNRNTFDGNIPTFQAALIKWFDNRWVIQSYLGIPFDQPVPDFKDSVALRFSQRAVPATQVIKIDDNIQTPVDSSTHVLADPPRDSPLEVAPTAPRTRAHPDRNDPRAKGSTFAKAFPDDGVGPDPFFPALPPVGENNYYGVPFNRPPPTCWTPAPLARPDTPVDLPHDLFPDCPQFARRYVPAMAVNEFLWYMDDAYIVALQWLASTPSDRHNRYKMFHHNCQLLRGSAANVIPFNGSFGGSAPQIAPPSAISAWPTSRVPPPNGAQNVTPSPVWLPRNQLPTGNAPVNSPCPTQFRY
ncbi:hypothetical protein Pst134EB_008789 [Puccinia striiformis f. sp. tritici]|uniref:Uncharacterized protein n=1 Tax=Puccinia striiformis f. sp. tritici PST-78 TaxID=1165861 RepID=A0A0L0V1W7_9BASI|nr:hypothetical protein Pst134EB_008789 [Puccinia striiformis f. sp. tritici]KNE93297.1 hypothetical protein PSTG_13337 [Puccinia striiformis f. sp. tritici PST-78]